MTTSITSEAFEEKYINLEAQLLYNKGMSVTQRSLITECLAFLLFLGFSNKYHSLEENCKLGIHHLRYDNVR